jgi:peptide deformylase
MAVRTVIYIDDERLRQKAPKVTRFTPALEQLAEDMLETMRAYNGVGLAGPQLGIMQRIFVAEIPPPKNDEDESHPQSGVSYVLVNPEISKVSKNLVEGQEGCLSIPTWYGLVERPEWVEVKAQDTQGRKLKLKVNGLLARIFMHEIDHLEGVLFLDHIKDPTKIWQLLPEDEKPETLQEVA